MNWPLIRAIILLPGTVLVFIPACVLWLSRNTRYAAVLIKPDQDAFWIVLPIGLFGVLLSTWTVTLFVKVGRGTPAPWETPKKLVVRGPYRHVRNPMIIGVLAILLAEVLLLRSWPLGCWMILFFLGNAVYFPLVEEKELEQRFGNEYLVYKRNVPRWIPRLRPWDGAVPQRATSESNSINE